MFYFIGLDQSTKATGYAVIDDKSAIIECGVFVPPDTKKVIKRTKALKEFLNKLLNKYDKNFILVGLEDTQESKMNYKTFQTLSKLLGAIELYLYEEDIKYEIVSVNTWRAVAGIKGKARAEKKQNAIDYISRKYNIDIEEDAAEALCIAEYLYKNSGF